MALASRKDLREAVRAARTAQAKWAERSGYNRGQILYRIAEMMEDRRATFEEQLEDGGATASRARAEVAASIDRMVWYAGWADKFAQIYGNLNPVAGPFFNISAPEPTGVVGVIAPRGPALLGLVSRLGPCDREREHRGGARLRDPADAGHHLCRGPGSPPMFRPGW